MKSGEESIGFINKFLLDYTVERKMEIGDELMSKINVLMRQVRNANYCLIAKKIEGKEKMDFLALDLGDIKIECT
jgi:hypothetical protein